MSRSKGVSVLVRVFLISGVLGFPIASIAQELSREDDLSYLLNEHGVFASVSSTGFWSNNILGDPNRSQAYSDIGEIDGWIVDSAATLGFQKDISQVTSVFGLGSAHFIDFSTYDKYNIDYFKFSGTLGLFHNIAPPLNLGFGGSCQSEQTSHFEEYYAYCGPYASAELFMHGGKINHGLSGAYSLSASGKFAKTYEIEGLYADAERLDGALHFDIEHGNHHLKITPYISRSAYQNDPEIEFYEENRVDTKYGILSDMAYHLSDNVVLGGFFEIYDNQSNYEEYKYWEIKAGPSIRLEF